MAIHLCSGSVLEIYTCKLQSQSISAVAGEARLAVEGQEATKQPTEAQALGRHDLLLRTGSDEAADEIRGSGADEEDDGHGPKLRAAAAPGPYFPGLCIDVGVAGRGCGGGSSES